MARLYHSTGLFGKVGGGIVVFNGALDGKDMDSQSE